MVESLRCRSPPFASPPLKSLRARIGMTLVGRFSWRWDGCVEVDDVAVGVSHPNRTAAPRLRRRRLDDDDAKALQALELRVDIVDLDLERVAADAGLRHRTRRH